MRATSVALITCLCSGAVWSTVQLVNNIIQAGAETDSAADLLPAGGNVWSGTVLACALLYFELDSGGRGCTRRAVARTPDLAFPQQLNPELNAAGWRPRSSTTSTSA